MMYYRKQIDNFGEVIATENTKDVVMEFKGETMLDEISIYTILDYIQDNFINVNSIEAVYTTKIADDNVEENGDYYSSGIYGIKFINNTYIFVDVDYIGDAQRRKTYTVTQFETFQELMYKMLF